MLSTSNSIGFAKPLNKVKVNEELTIDQVAGVYNSVYLLPNQKVLFIAYGTIVRGSWRIQGKHILIDVVEEPAYIFYGRRLKGLGDKKQINLRFKDQSYRRSTFNSDVGKSITRQGVNCALEEEVIILDSNVKRVEFGLVREPNFENSFNEMIEFYTFELSDKYNEYLIFNLDDGSQKTRFSNFVWSDDFLYSAGANNGVKRKALPDDSSEEMQMIKKWSGDSLTPTVLKWGDELYPYLGPIRDHNNIEYNTEINGELVSVYKKAYQHYQADFFEIALEDKVEQELTDSIREKLADECNVKH